MVYRSSWTYERPVLRDTAISMILPYKYRTLWSSCGVRRGYMLIGMALHYAVKVD